MGVLYYARYFELLELGRTEWQRDEGLHYAQVESEMGLMLPVITAECSYRMPLRFDDLALIETTVDAWSPTTLSFASKVYRTSDQLKQDGEQGLVDPLEELCAEGRVVLGCISKDNWRPSRLPQKYLELLEMAMPERKGRR